MAESSFLTAVRESHDTVAADHLARVPPPSDGDPPSGAMPAVFAEFHRTLAPGGTAVVVSGHGTGARIGSRPRS